MKPNKVDESLSKYQKFVVAVLAFLQFTIVLDFMIISPLGALLMPALKISTAQFGIVVSAYAFSAGLSGILSAGFADRFDRKKMLIFFYIGFVLGTLICGLAPSYSILVVGRIVTGLFGGVIGSIVLAITTDLFSFQLRGRVMGIIHTAFASSQILGIPISLYLSNHLGWQSPFLMIVILGAFVGTIIFIYLQPIKNHLSDVSPTQNPFHHLWSTVTKGKFHLAFIVTCLLPLGGYMLMPFGSAFTVHNLGISMDRLPTVYLFTGIFSLFIGPLIGRASDFFGKFEVFLFGAFLTALMVVIYTNLGVTPLLGVVIVNIILYIGIFSRIIPSQTLLSALPEANMRGSFMAVSSSLQQISGGISSVVAGLVVVETPNGQLENFNTIGYILVGTVFLTAIMMYHIQKNMNHSSSYQEQKV